MQGVFGGISTIGLVLVTASSPAEKTSSNLGYYQSSLTLGQLAGLPLLYAAISGLSACGLVFFMVLFRTEDLRKELARS
jgi:hypothetical protein